LGAGARGDGRAARPRGDVGARRARARRRSGRRRQPRRRGDGVLDLRLSPPRGPGEGRLGCARPRDVLLPEVRLRRGGARARPRALGAAALPGAAIALQASAGYPGFTLCLGALLALATVVEAARAGRGAPGVVVVAGASAAFAFAFAAPQVLPLAEMVGESSRESLVAATHLGGFHPSLMAVPRVRWGALASLFLFAGPAMGFAVGGLVLGR